MIELGTIAVKDEVSVIEARNKVLVLAESCGFDDIGSVRLATITSEICRMLQKTGSSSKLTISIAEKDNRHGVLLIFFGNIKPFAAAGFDLFFNQITTSHSQDGELRTEAFCFIPDAGFELTEDFIAATQDRLIQQSAAELFEELERKNEELSGLLEERNDVVQKLREKTVELETETRLKSEFLANMSHELRTPLNSIIGFTLRVIKKAGKLLPKRQFKNLHTVARNAQHLLSLINALLDISKIEAGKMDIFLEDFSIYPLISEVIDLTRALIGDKNIKLESLLPENEITLYSDRSKLKQILINLVSNSIKFTESGRVTISTSMVDRDTIAEKNSFFQPDTDYIEVIVTDTGIGLDHDEKQIIFEAFRQVDGSLTRKEGGSGLGLTITRKFTDLLQGRVDVESIKKSGTTFTITLPIRMSGQNPKKYEPEELETVPIIKDHHTVLCIDDDPDVRELLQGYLTDEGFNVITARSGDEGLQKAAELQPLAITLDIQMPVKDGWTVLSELKSDKATAEIPVVIVSITDNRSLGFGLGAFDYLQKPILPDALIPAVNKILRRKARNILAVDDDPGVHDLLNQILTEEQIALRTASNGRQAIESLNEMIPDLILLDLMMPEMDGFETARQIREKPEWAEIPILVLTAKTLSRAEKNFLDQRVEAIITKEGLSSEIVLQEISTALKKVRRRFE
ncbi:response regulator [Desulfobacterales bacterium HSG16]|nr:response regulator [Desulfobacterales bacterium HSG16]